MKSLVLSALLLLSFQGLYSQGADTVKHPFGIFIEYRGYIDEKLCLKYKFSSNDCILLQLQVASNIFENSSPSPYNDDDGDWNAYGLFIGYQRTIGLFEEINLALQAGVERQWRRATRTEGVYTYDQINRVQVFQYNMDTEERTIDHRIKFGIGAEHYLNEQISVGIQKLVYYGITDQYRTDIQQPPNRYLERGFFFENSSIILTYYF